MKLAEFIERNHGKIEKALKKIDHYETVIYPRLETEVRDLKDETKIKIDDLIKKTDGKIKEFSNFI